MKNAPSYIILFIAILLQAAIAQDKALTQLPPKEIEDGDLIYTVSGGTDYKVDIGEELDTRDTANRDRSNHTGEQSIDTVAGLQTALDDRETVAELDARSALDRARANHTGEQAISTVTDLQAALDRSPPIYVLSMGQSNSLGRSATGGDKATSPLVKVWNTTNEAWETWDLTSDPAQYGVGATVGANSIPFHFAKQLSEFAHREVRVVVSSEGGRPITDWVPASATRYADMEAQVTAAGITDFDVVLWHQGESDFATATNTYRASFDALVTQLRAEDYISDSVPIIAGQLANPPHDTALGNEQNALYNSTTFSRDYNYQGVYLAELDTLPVIDGAHFDGAALVTAGRERYWEAYLAAHGAVPQPARRPDLPNSVALDGVDDYVTLPSLAYDGTANTVRVVLTPSADTGVNVIVGFDQGLVTASTTERFIVTLDGYEVRVLVRNGVDTEISYPTGVHLEPGDESELVITRDEGLIKIYVDGRLEAQKDHTFPSTVGPTVYRLGAYSTLSGFAEASLHEFQWWPSELTEAEVTRVWHNGAASVGGATIDLDNPSLMKERWGPDAKYAGGPTVTETLAYVGRMIVGDTTTTYTDPAVIIERDLNDAAGVSGHGFVDNTDIDSGYSYAAFDNQLNVTGTKDYSARHVSGFQSNGIYEGTSALQNWYAYTSTFTNNGGNVGAYYGVRVINPAGTGTYGSKYGVFADVMTGATTNNYQFFAAGTTGKSYIGGSLLINDADETPDGRLVVKALATGTKPIMLKNTSGNEIIQLWNDGDGDGQLWLNDSAGTAKIVQNANGNSYFNGGKVGFGITGPLAPVHTYSNTDSEYAARFENDHSDGWGVLVDVDATVSADPALWVKNATETLIWSGADGKTAFGGTSASERVDVTGAVALREMTAPSGLGNAAKIYAEDNGAGKTRLMVKFGSGAAVQLAIEP